AVIRVNSQSGKGGMAYLLERDLGLELPRRLQIDFARHVQAHADEHGAELDAAALWAVFERAYRAGTGRFELVDCVVEETGAGSRVTVGLRVDGAPRRAVVDGAGPVEALVAALAEHDAKIDVLGLHQTALGHGDDAEALTLLEYRRDGEVSWSMGRDRSVLAATAAAVIGAAQAT
ncbi:alpha-isopropylmalate synthase regulatory domain-containing protein, partial [Tsukamurella pulmonis]